MPGNRLLSYSILTLMIVTGPLATGRTLVERRVTIGLALLMVLLGYVSSFSARDVWLYAAEVSGVGFFFALTYLISRRLLFEHKEVTAETLWAAINVYLLLGMLFAFLYALVVQVEPGAFAGKLLESASDGSQTFIYYSFVTMTTLGYGDITPQIHVAATLAYVQALIGQLYVAILIARLVSSYNTQSVQLQENKEPAE